MCRRLMWNQARAEISTGVGSFRCFSDRRHTSLELRLPGEGGGAFHQPLITFVRWRCGVLSLMIPFKIPFNTCDDSTKAAVIVLESWLIGVCCDLLSLKTEFQPVKMLHSVKVFPDWYWLPVKLEAPCMSRNLNMAGSLTLYNMVST